MANLIIATLILLIEKGTLMIIPTIQSEQLPLVHIIYEDDRLMSQTPEAEWYRILSAFPWKNYRNIAAIYYDALYHFNQKQHKDKETDIPLNHKNYETKNTAEQRLLFERSTMDENAPVLYQQEERPPLVSTVDPKTLAPNIVPFRLAGKKPKCFFALFKAFVGTTLLGFAPEPENVHALLKSNLPFARVCGFVPKEQQDHYWHRHVPSLRKLEQFDQIMTGYALWAEQKWEEIRQNIANGTIKPESEIVGDTTHYHAYSGFKTVTFYDNKGQEIKKSQSKVTKSCHCQNKNTCPHQWILADDGAGTIVKSTTKMYWGHKASILGLPKQGIPLDAAAVADAASHDGRTLFPHVKQLHQNLPEVKDWFTRALYDSACDDQTLKQLFWDEFRLELKTSLNPRRIQTVTEGLPRSMERLSPYGELYCKAGHEMEYKGARFDTERFIFGPPQNDWGYSRCSFCAYQIDCCPQAENGRTVTLSFDFLPHIDPDDPPMAKRYKAIMSRRPSVERMIKRLKCDLSDDRLSKRGNASFQAYLDKTMIAFHMLLRQ